MRAGRGYEKLTDVVDDDSEDERYLIDKQYRMPQRPFPKKEIIAGFILLFVGCAMIFLGFLIHFEHLKNEIPGELLVPTIP